MDGTSHVWRRERILLYLALIVLWSVIIPVSSQDNKSETGLQRKTCIQNRRFPSPSIITEHKKRLHALREQMLIQTNVQGSELDGYILTSYDAHLNEEIAPHDRRLQFITGFNGTTGLAAITLERAAFWTEERYLEQADGEIDCEWELHRIDDQISITEWLSNKLHMGSRIGADPHTVPHFTWKKWDNELSHYHLRLRKIYNNLVDFVWTIGRPPPVDITIKVQEVRFAGEKWVSKIEELRSKLRELHCDAMIVTSLTEIAYILNIRARDIPYIPVVKGYLLVTQREIFFYTDRRKVTIGITFHLKADLCYNDLCVNVKEYDDVWVDLRTKSQAFNRILVPAPCVFDKGVSEAIYSSISFEKIFETISPIIYMKAQKNHVEITGMETAHIRDGAAMCEAMSNLEERFSDEKWTELKIKYEVERSRLSQPHSKGLSLATIVAFGKHSSLPYYTPSSVTDIEVNDSSMLVIESGGQYFEGTTDVSRTFHFGEATDEQKRAYTTVLAGIIRLANLKIPANLYPSEVDALSRSPVWDSMTDYPQATGHGIGSYLSVKESPIDVSYKANRGFLFQEGYFFSNEPGYYIPGEFGVRLGNVLEVVDTGRQHPSGEKFLAFKDVTLVPYEPNLIDRTLLSAAEKRWINKYNAKVRQLVGEELKRQGNMKAFYWMMNKTSHIREYLSEEEYRGKSDSTKFLPSLFISLLVVYQIILNFP